MYVCNFKESITKVVSVTLLVLIFCERNHVKLKRGKEKKNNTDASEKRNCIVRQCRGYWLQKTTLRYCCSKLHPPS